LNQYTSGFVNPAFSVSNPANGSVALLADGHGAVHLNGGFTVSAAKFTVTDSAAAR
jgi:hypothetical protein